jgi:anti-sigma regulatory factor (Ser/Thr protein kinase)
VRVLLSLSIHHDQDVVTARQRAAQIAALLDFDGSEQTRIATAVSEIVRNAFRYAGGGTVALAVLHPHHQPQRPAGGEQPQQHRATTPRTQPL